MQSGINRIMDLIGQLNKDNIIVAIDGRCGGGKTTLASELSKDIDCNVIHMDDFFLRPEQRTAERLNTPGENVDHERFLNEVLIPLSENRAFTYRPFSCKNQSLGEEVEVESKPVTIVEGSYSCHPDLWGYYDLRIFVDIDPDEQMKRIINRNGQEGAQTFKDKWIPLEEKYFKAYSIKDKSDFIV